MLINKERNPRWLWVFSKTKVDSQIIWDAEGSPEQMDNDSLSGNVWRLCEVLATSTAKKKIPLSH